MRLLRWMNVTQSFFLYDEEIMRSTLLVQQCLVRISILLHVRSSSVLKGFQIKITPQENVFQ